MVKHQTKILMKRTKREFGIEIVLSIISILAFLYGLLEAITTVNYRFIGILSAAVYISYVVVPVLLVSALIHLSHKKKWTYISKSALPMVVGVAIFIVIFHRPVFNVYLTENFSGEVKLYVSNELRDDLLVDSNGVGYISRKSFDKHGLYRVFRGTTDITERIRNLTFTGMTTRRPYTLENVSFSVPNDVDEVPSTSSTKMELDSSRLFVTFGRPNRGPIPDNLMPKLPKSNSETTVVFF